VFDVENEKFNVFINSVSDSFKNVVSEVSELDFKECAKTQIAEERKFYVVIGVIGKNKGRILLEAGGSVIKLITEKMNDGPFTNIMDMYACLSELTNMFCGNAITLINNKYRGSDLRLTPPAVFAGAGLDVTTPSIKSTCTYYKYEQGVVILDIGFEGV
jgi:CheY-specific phosphatase CheX